MKKLISIIVVSVLLTVNCAGTKMLNGTEYKSYGVLSTDRKKENVCYETRKKSIVLSIIFCETIIVPLVLLGYKLFEPEKTIDQGEKCE